MNNTKSDSEITIYSIVGATIICYFVPIYIPYAIFGGGLLCSLYKIANIISKSDYVNNNYVSKENIKYFEK